MAIPSPIPIPYASGDSSSKQALLTVREPCNLMGDQWNVVGDIVRLILSNMPSFIYITTPVIVENIHAGSATILPTYCRNIVWSLMFMLTGPLSTSTLNRTSTCIHRHRCTQHYNHKRLKGCAHGGHVQKVTTVSFLNPRILSTYCKHLEGGSPGITPIFRTPVNRACHEQYCESTWHGRRRMYCKLQLP